MSEYEDQTFEGGEFNGEFNAEQNEFSGEAPEEKTEKEINYETGSKVGEEKGEVTTQKSVSIAPKDTTNSTNIPPKIKSSGLLKRRKKSKTCVGQPEWKCEDEALWRIYMQIYLDDLRKKDEAMKEEYGEFYRKKYKPGEIPQIPSAWLPPKPARPPCAKLNVLNREGRLDDLQARIWRNLRDPRLCLEPTLSISSSIDIEWPKLWPCSERDVVRERKVLLRKLKMKQMGALPCEIEEIDSPGTSDDEDLQEMANLKELGHARIPLTSSKKKNILMVDRSSGENPGLVSGDFLIFELNYKKTSRTYANVCLQGLVGMHLAELHRSRQKSWKFCLFQALVALLAKTQFRYKFVWSANIDYIYQQAWMLFLHVGCLAVQDNQRFDDVLVYNYKYSVELELIQELKDVPVVLDMAFRCFERSMTKRQQRNRRELTIMKANFGTDKTKDRYRLPVHRGTKVIEKWFEELELDYTNCIFKTGKFAVAFWQDGAFWYVYNPYRCDKYGFYNDRGAACIVKLCTRDSLRRYLMLLTIKAYAYRGHRDDDLEDDPEAENECPDATFFFEDCFDIQIFQMIYHCCQIHNVKLYTRTPRKPKVPMEEKKKPDPCTFDPLAHLMPKTCEEEEAEREAKLLPEDLSDKMERSHWVKELKVTWSKVRSAETNVCNQQNTLEDRPKWHSFDVVEPRRVFVLFGSLHITDRDFIEENRGKQVGPCYAVCAAMSLINAPEYWTPEVLNALVVAGDKFYSQRSRKIPQIINDVLTPLDCLDNDYWDERPHDYFRVDEFRFELQVKPPIQGRLFAASSLCLWRTIETFFQNYRFGQLACESARLAIFKHCGAYYMLDVRSHGPPIYGKGMGAAYLLRTTCMVDFIKSLVVLIGSPECSKFLIWPMEIVKTEDSAECGKLKTCKVQKCPTMGRTMKTSCPFEDEKRKAMRNRPVAGEPKETIDTKVCLEEQSDDD